MRHPYFANVIVQMVCSMLTGFILSDAPLMKPKPTANTTAIVDGTPTVNETETEAERQRPTSKVKNKAPVCGLVSTLCSSLAASAVPNVDVNVNVGGMVDRGALFSAIGESELPIISSRLISTSPVIKLMPS